MIVTCPNCFSKYVVRPESLGAGKLVRCAVCGTVWQQAPIDEKKLKKARIISIVQWTFFYAVVFTSISLLILGRDFIVAHWPASESFYERINSYGAGLANNTFSLDNVSYFFVRKDGDLYIGLRGELCNTSMEVRSVPSITITLRNDPEITEESFKKVWIHKLQYEKLLPAQKVLFETKLQRVSCNNLLCDIKLNFL